jgi:asparagine synthetase B (glutamine-hydrolysing)
VLFSGGIDSVVLACCLHLSLPPEATIDLINVTFDGVGESQGLDCVPTVTPALRVSACIEDKPAYITAAIESAIVALRASQKPYIELALSFPDSPVFGECAQEEFLQHKQSQYVCRVSSPDRLAAYAALLELRALYPSRAWQLVCVDVSAAERASCEGRIKSLIAPCDTHMDLNIGTAFWFAARGRGYIPAFSSSVDVLYSVVDKSSGRPLLRKGPAGAAEGVGRSINRILVINM